MVEPLCRPILETIEVFEESMVLLPHPHRAYETTLEDWSALVVLLFLCSAQAHTVCRH